MPNYEIIRYSPTNHHRWVSNYFETKGDRIYYQDKRLYLQSPELTLQSIEGDWLYLSFEEKHHSFRTLLEALDQIFRVSNASENGLLSTLRDYRSIIISNFVDRTSGILFQWNHTEIYDHDHVLISKDAEHLHVGQKVIALILVDRVNQHGLHLDLKQLQIAFKHPFEKCLLSDEEIDELI